MLQGVRFRVPTGGSGMGYRDLRFRFSVKGQSETLADLTRAGCMQSACGILRSLRLTRPTDLPHTRQIPGLRISHVISA